LKQLKYLKQTLATCIYSYCNIDKHPDETLKNVRLKHLKHLNVTSPAITAYLVRNCDSPLLDGGQGLGSDTLGGGDESLGLDGHSSAVGIGLRDDAIALGEDAGRWAPRASPQRRCTMTSRMHCDDGQMLSNRTTGAYLRATLALAAPTEATSADPSGSRAGCQRRRRWGVLRHGCDM
jgi:hypothetical protein